MDQGTLSPDNDAVVPPDLTVPVVIDHSVGNKRQNL